ncbi:protein SCO1/2 [Humitalea rosea]|uniref:Protein SCO1/2 n=2 Tax=Humitalea rosea TaxID=990373 RepID=A0A2W7IST7_9PROT|nr:protein SCO1/2 [Humitalea rosea]
MVSVPPGLAYLAAMLRPIRAIALVLMLLLAGLWGAAWVLRAPGEGIAESFVRQLAFFSGAGLPPPSAGGVTLPEGVTLGGPYSLTDQTGRAVTEATYAGGLSLMYFGFTYCPDVCPTELGIIGQVMEELGPDASRVTPILVTIDPERDTPEVLAAYVVNFHPKMVGLTGTAAQIADVARKFRVYYQRVRNAENSDYLMDHSSFIYLVGSDGRVRGLFRPGSAPEAIAEAVRGALRAG